MPSPSRRSRLSSPRRARSRPAKAVHRDQADTTTEEKPRLSVRGRRIVVAGAAVAGSAIVAGTVNFFLPALLGLTQNPLLVNVEDDPGTISSFADVGQVLALPASARKQNLGQPDAQGCLDFHRWAHQFGGIDAGATRFRVTVQGNDSSPVLISQIRVRVLGREPASDGAYVACETAGDASIRPMKVDLDATSPIVQPAEPQKKPFGVTVGQGEIEVFDMVAQGLTSAQIAGRLAISSRTVESHRSQIMDKMKAESVAMLVRQAVRLGRIAA